MIAGILRPHPEPGATLELFRWPAAPVRARPAPVYLARIPSGSWLAGQAGGYVVRTWPPGRVLELPARRVRVQFVLVGLHSAIPHVSAADVPALQRTIADLRGRVRR